MKAKVWSASAEVIEIHDGDTFTVRINLGWNIFYKTKIRLEGVNAPELETPEGNAARNFVAQVMPPGTLIEILSHRLDKYGRAQASVQLPSGVDLAEKLLEAGHVAQMDGYAPARRAVVVLGERKANEI